MAAMCNNIISFLWDEMFFLMQNVFNVSAMQHGCREKALLEFSLTERSEIRWGLSPHYSAQ